MKNICIIRDDRLGDTILTLPILKKIKIEHPNARITLIIAKISKDLMGMINFVDNYLVYKKSLKFLYELNKTHFDLLINFSPLKNRNFKLLIQAKRKVNVTYLSRYKDSNNTNFIKKSFYELFFDYNYIFQRNDIDKLDHHTIMMNQVLIGEGFSTNLPPKISLTHDAKNKYDILIHLSNRWLNKEYLVDDLINLIQKLYKINTNIIFTTELSVDNNIKLAIDSIKLINNFEIYFQPNFMEWTLLISQSKNIITPECGCSHISGLFNKNTVIVYDKNNKPDFIKKEYSPYMATNIRKLNSNKGPDLNNEIIKSVQELHR